MYYNVMITRMSHGDGTFQVHYSHRELKSSMQSLTGRKIIMPACLCVTKRNRQDEEPTIMQEAAIVWRFCTSLEGGTKIKRAGCR